MASEDEAASALFAAIVGLSEHADPAELLTLAEVYEKIVGGDTPDAPPQQDWSVDPTQMIEQREEGEGARRIGFSASVNT